MNSLKRRAAGLASAVLISLVPLLAASALVGCSKSSSQPPPGAGPHVDTVKLRQAFANSTPEIHTALDQAAFGIRYGKYAQAQEALEKLAADPSLTEPQKKIVNDSLEQLKKMEEAQAAAPPTPAQ